MKIVRQNKKLVNGERTRILVEGSLDHNGENLAFVSGSDGNRVTLFMVDHITDSHVFELQMTVAEARRIAGMFLSVADSVEALRS